MTRRVREQRTKEFMEIGAQAEGKPFKSPGEYPRGPRLLFVPVAFAVVRLDVWMQQRLILSLGITHKHGGQLASLGHLFKVRHPVQRFGNIRAERIKHLRLFEPHRHALRDSGKCVGYSERAIPQSISEREWPDRQLTGTVATDGNSASGSYSAPAGGCTNGDTGTWTGTRTSVSGTFSGALTIPGYMPVGLTMQLRDEGGRVTGTGTVTNSTCLSTLVINGSVSGLRVDLTGKDEGRGGSVAFGGSTEK